MLQEFGPRLRRPYCDTLKGSKYPNLKELRYGVKSGAWRIAMAYDPKRRAVLLAGGNEAERSQARSYGSLVQIAESRYQEWLEEIGDADV